MKIRPQCHNPIIHWRWQRYSAVLLIFLSLWFLSELLRQTQLDYHSVHAWIAQPLTAVVLSLFVGMMFYHGALGLQVVIEDYIPNQFWQKILIIKVKLMSLILVILSWFFIFQIAVTSTG